MILENFFEVKVLFLMKNFEIVACVRFSKFILSLILTNSIQYIYLKNISVKLKKMSDIEILFLIDKR
jgi:hypothetical protein